MSCLTFSKLSLFRNALLQCEIHILAKFNNRSKFCSDVLRENYCLIKVYFVHDQFSMSGFFLFWFVCFFFNPLTICQIPLSVLGLGGGGGGFQLTSGLLSPSSPNPEILHLRYNPLTPCKERGKTFKHFLFLSSSCLQGS